MNRSPSDAEGDACACNQKTVVALAAVSTHDAS